MRALFDARSANMPPKFVPRQRKHKAIARQKTAGHSAAVDANAEEIVPVEQQEHNAKKAALKEELVQESQGKVTGKKKKRLDKYIDTKLKKEENLALLKKLAAQKVDTSLFQSSKKLGRGSETKREALRRALAESRAGIDVEKNEALLLEPRDVREYEPASPDGDGDSDGDDAPTQPTARPASPTPAVPPPPPNNGSNGLFGRVGSGLKRPLEVDESGKPVIQVRKRRKGLQKKPIAVAEDVEWEGFSSGAESSNEGGV